MRLEQRNLKDMLMLNPGTILMNVRLINFRGIGNINPLMKIAELSFMEDTTYLPVGLVASKLRKTVGQAKSQLIDISSMGFIQYSSNSSHVIVEQKLLNYALSKKGEKDYDELMFVTDLRPKMLNYSEMNSQGSIFTENTERISRSVKRRKRTPCYAYIDVDKNEIYLNEIERLISHPSNRTVLFPDSSYIRMLENRDIVFSGWLMSGKLITHNIESIFDYDDFTISIDTTNEAYLSVSPLNPRDGGRPIDMVSSFNDFKGEIVH